jgi:RNA polymerase sigma factor (sigma-70 family)
MTTALGALISGQRTGGEAHVDHELATQLAALHAQNFGWALACCDRRREDAEDLLHDVYARVLDNGLRYDGRSSLKTWMFGVIAGMARSRRRRERLRALLGVSRAARIDTPAPSASPADDAESADCRDRTRRALGRLAGRQREVLLLVFYHDLTIDEAANVMGVTVGSARVHYQRGKRRMAALLEDQRP